MKPVGAHLSAEQVERPSSVIAGGMDTADNKLNLVELLVKVGVAKPSICRVVSNEVFVLAEQVLLRQWNFPFLSSSHFQICSRELGGDLEQI